MALHLWAQGGQVQGGGSVRLNYRVRIAHGHGDGFVLPVPDGQHNGRLHHGHAHPHRRPRRRAVPDEQGQLPLPRPGLDGEMPLVCQPLVVHVLAKAADAVAAHGPLGAVGVEHPHFEIRPLGRAHTDDAVPAHAEVPVRQAAGQLGQAVRRTGHAVDKNVIIPQTVHFGKAHTLPSLWESVCALPAQYEAGGADGPEAAGYSNSVRIVNSSGR